MALKSTVFKAELQISDMDRNYYQHHSITIAKHPSETDERMMVRILAFLLNAAQTLTFANGLSSQDEPDLWEKDYTGAIDLWIMVGLPDGKAIKKACGRAKRVLVYSYGGSASSWFSSLDPGRKLTNVTVIHIDQSEKLAKLAKKSMKFQATIQDGIVWLSHEDGILELKPTKQ